MNTAHWHLLLNHLPIVGTLLGTLLLVSGFFLKNNLTVKQTALGVFIFSGLSAIPAYLTGEGAEDIAEGLPDVTENVIEIHEDLAKTFLIVVLILGVLSLFTLIASLYKSKFAALSFSTVLVASLATCFFAKQVGTSGGEIRHTEIRSGNTNPNSNTGQQQGEDEESDED